MTGLCRRVARVALVAVIGVAACDPGTDPLGTASIHVLAYVDVDRSGDRGEDDVPIGEAGVTLTSVEGGLTETAATDADGTATFDLLTRGTYTLSIELPASVRNVLPAADTVVTVEIGEGTLSATSVFRFVRVEAADLAGDWNATEFRYTDNEVPDLSLDAITDAAGSVRLTVEESGSFSGSATIPGLTVDSAGNTVTLGIAGALAVTGDTLDIDFDPATEEAALFADFRAWFILDGDVLTFTDPLQSFDFPDTIEEQLGLGARGPVPATLDARLER